MLSPQPEQHHQGSIPRLGRFIHSSIACNYQTPLCTQTHSHTHRHTIYNTFPYMFRMTPFTHARCNYCLCSFFLPWNPKLSWEARHCFESAHTTLKQQRHGNSQSQCSRRIFMPHAVELIPSFRCGWRRTHSLSYSIDQKGIGWLK